MKQTIHAQATAIINAPPETVYGVFSDYAFSHLAILPRQYFSELVVEKGGQGAGTVFRLKMNVLGAKREFREVVSEPEPGRVLVERDESAGVVTTFTVNPLNGGRFSEVTIASKSRPSPGLMGVMERLMNPPITRRIFKAELQQLAKYVSGDQADGVR